MTKADPAVHTCSRRGGSARRTARAGGHQPLPTLSTTTPTLSTSVCGSPTVVPWRSTACACCGTGRSRRKSRSATPRTPTAVTHLVLEGSDWTSPLESDRGSRAGCATSRRGRRKRQDRPLHVLRGVALRRRARRAGRGLLAVEVLRGGCVVARADEPLTASWSTVGASSAPGRNRSPRLALR